MHSEDIYHTTAGTYTMRTRDNHRTITIGGEEREFLGGVPGMFLPRAGIAIDTEKMPIHQTPNEGDRLLTKVRDKVLPLPGVLYTPRN